MADARELAELLVQSVRDLATARAERESYRVLAQQAIHRLHANEVERKRMEASHQRLLDEYRSYRQATICTPARVAS